MMKYTYCDIKNQRHLWSQSFGFPVFGVLVFEVLSRIPVIYDYAFIFFRKLYFPRINVLGIYIFNTKMKHKKYLVKLKFPFLFFFLNVCLNHSCNGYLLKEFLQNIRQPASTQLNISENLTKTIPIHTRS